MSKLTENLLRALKLDKEGRWNQAHRAVQTIEDPMAYWIHAYLHRKEGDQGNASYWYTRAGQVYPEGNLDDEWQSLYDTLQKQPV